jgi:hypothetical protein
VAIKHIQQVVQLVAELDGLRQCMDVGVQNQQGSAAMLLKGSQQTQQGMAAMVDKPPRPLDKHAEGQASGSRQRLTRGTIAYHACNKVLPRHGPRCQANNI